MKIDDYNKHYVNLWIELWLRQIYTKKQLNHAHLVTGPLQEKVAIVKLLWLYYERVVLIVNGEAFLIFKHNFLSGSESCTSDTSPSSIFIHTKTLPSVELPTSF